MAKKVAKKESDVFNNFPIIEQVNKILEKGDMLGGAKLPFDAVVGSSSFLPDGQSFGNKTLKENAILCQEAMDISDELQEIWNHAHTQFAWKHINFSNHDHMLNMRQISAEISSKADTLRNLKWSLLDNEIKQAELESRISQLDENSSDTQKFKKMRLILSLARMKEDKQRTQLMIEGTMKDMIAIKSSYDDLSKHVENLSEMDIEERQAQQHMCRSIMQCLRDVRQFGHITKGEQEYAEQIGINPSKLLQAIRNYLEREAQSDSWDTRELNQFINGLANELSNNMKVHEKRMEYSLFNPKPIEAASSVNRLQLNKADKALEG